MIIAFKSEFLHVTHNSVVHDSQVLRHLPKSHEEKLNLYQIRAEAGGRAIHRQTLRGTTVSRSMIAFFTIRREGIYLWGSK